MIKSIILDVDGVIIGEKVGFNSPWPHPKVINKLRQIKSQGIFISLCTAKPHFSIDKIIQDADLDDLHITDGGGIIINPISGKIVKQHTIDSLLAQQLINAYLDQQVYIEFYTINDYFIQKNQASSITNQHQHILQRPPKLVDSLAKTALSHKITKLMPIAKDEADKDRLIKIFQPFQDKLTLSWGVHPVALPLQFGIITAPGISKKQGAIEISRVENIPFEQILGIGDSSSDWQFIELCGYAAAMGNATQELKDLVLSKGPNFSYIGPSVDENGILKIFDHFLPNLYAV